MDYLLKKDKRRRKSFYYSEIKRFMLKAISMNQMIHMNLRIAARVKLFQYPQDCSATRHVNRCALTGKSRSIYRYAHLNRHTFKMMANDGLLPGIRKSSW